MWYHHISVNPNPCISECQEFCYLMLPPLCSLFGLMAALRVDVGRLRRGGESGGGK